LEKLQHIQRLLTCIKIQRNIIEESEQFTTYERETLLGEPELGSNNLVEIEKAELNTAKEAGFN